MNLKRKEKNLDFFKLKKYVFTYIFKYFKILFSLMCVLFSNFDLSEE